MHELATFARTLKRLRESRGLSQSGLAREAAIPQTTVSRWESSEAEPGLLGIRKLAQFFEVSADVLCGLSSPPDALRPGNWLIDMDAFDDAHHSKQSELWAVAIPDRFRLVTSSEYQRLRDQVHRGKR